MRPALRRPSPCLGMVSLLSPTDRGVGGAEPGTVALGTLPSSAASWCLSGAAAPEAGLPGPELLPSVHLRLALQTTGLSAYAPRPRPPSGSAGEEETWLPPGDNARENLDSTSRRGREPGSPTSSRPADTSAPQIQRHASRGQGPLTLPLQPLSPFGGLGSV